MPDSHATVETTTQEEIIVATAKRFRPLGSAAGSPQQKLAVHDNSEGASCRLKLVQLLAVGKCLFCDKSQAICVEERGNSKLCAAVLEACVKAGSDTSKQKWSMFTYNAAEASFCY